MTSDRVTRKSEKDSGQKSKEETVKKGKIVEKRRKSKDKVEEKRERTNKNNSRRKNTISKEIKQ